MSAQLSCYVAVYSRHFVTSCINAVVVAVVFSLDHIVTTQTTMGWTESLLYETDWWTHAAVLRVPFARWRHRRYVGYGAHDDAASSG